MAEDSQEYNTGVQEIFSNFGKDPCLGKPCVQECPVGFTCIRAVPPRSGEFRLDLFSCNLNCPFCWTISKPRAWRSEEIFERVKCRFGKFYDSGLAVSIGYVRVTGGEPLLGEGRLRHLFQLFKLIDKDLERGDAYSIWRVRKSPRNLNGRRNIKIQTNGITVLKLLDLLSENLKDLQNLALTFEVSLKGSNPQEFQILSGGFPSELSTVQIQGIHGLLNLEDQGFPVFTRGILGIFHSAQYDLVLPGTEERMFMHPSEEFQEVIRRLQRMPRSSERVYVEPLRFTSHMAEREQHCFDIRILAKSSMGTNIVPGKKISINETYLGKILK